jgi:uncharacterized membrane protein
VTSGDIPTPTRFLAWRQIAIVLVVSAITAAISCAGGGHLIDAKNSFVGMVGGILLGLGLLGIVGFLFGIIAVVVRLFVDLER